MSPLTRSHTADPLVNVWFAAAQFLTSKSREEVACLRAVGVSFAIVRGWLDLCFSGSFTNKLIRYARHQKNANNTMMIPNANSIFCSFLYVHIDVQNCSQFLGNVPTFVIRNCLAEFTSQLKTHSNT